MSIPHMKYDIHKVYGIWDKISLYAAKAILSKILRKALISNSNINLKIELNTINDNVYTTIHTFDITGDTTMLNKIIKEVEKIKWELSASG